jgi:hypothetical protein
MNFLRNRRKTLPRINVGNWIEAGCCVSCCSLVTGWLFAFATGNEWLAVPALIPTLLTIAAIYKYDWRTEI